MFFALALCILSASARARDDSATKKTTTPATSQKPASTTAQSKTHTTSKKRRKKSTRLRGQQKIDSERAQQIQEALIREHYLKGEPTGSWNQATEDALRRFQAANGWQSKTVPDSRALIKLGLGPSKDHLLNPESAMTTVPDPPKSDAPTPTSHTAKPVADPVSPATPPSVRPASNPSSPQ